MIIRLSQSQQSRLLALTAQHTADEIVADCLPSGYVVQIGVCAEEACAELILGSRRFELGSVDVRLQG